MEPQGPRSEHWLSLVPVDPRPWLLGSDEPSARWLTLAWLVEGTGDGHVRAARAEVLADAGTQGLLDRLPAWGAGTTFSGHGSPAFAPNMLNLLADMGLEAGDDPRIEALLDAMLERQRTDGRLPSFGSYPRGAEPVWGALPCDTHAITEVMVRFGRGDDERVQRAAARIEADLARTQQGRGWLCLPDPATGFRGPGRKQDVCPQVSLEALRVMATLGRRSTALREAVSTLLGCWRRRASERPYMFGHGRRFKTVKWPTFWYDVYAVLNTVRLFPEVWQGAAADAADRRAVAELVGCLVAYNVGKDGTVTPRSCYRGFEGYSLGQKKRPSPFATARVMVVLADFAEIADEVAAIDVTALPSSRGEDVVPLPPRA